MQVNFTPQVIPDTPLPGLPFTNLVDANSSLNNLTPAQIGDTQLSDPVVASDVVSNSLDSLTGRIKGGFQFTQMGNIEIGQIFISSTGILTQDSLGNTTFGLDADTGDATFKGTIVAGSIIAADISANHITTGTLNGIPVTNSTISGTSTWNGNQIAQAYIGNLTAAIITSGDIATARIQANVLSALQAVIGNLSAIKADIGTITAGTLNLTNIKMDSSEIQIGGGENLVFVSSIGGTIQGLMGYNAGAINLIGANGNDLVLGNSGGGVVIVTSTMDTASINATGNCDLGNHALGSVAYVNFQARDTSWTPGNSEFGMEDNGTNQRLRVKFSNNGTQWSINLSSICTPVDPSQADPIYAQTYNLMPNMDDSRFKLTYPDTEEVQEEYRGKPLSHFPSMGDDGTAVKEHQDAMWHRPWIPILEMPDRMETMGQYPYPPVHSRLIGEGESMGNMYQLLAHAYNKLQDRLDALDARLVANGI